MDPGEGIDFCLKQFVDQESHRDHVAYRDKTGAEAGAEARAEAEAGILANRETGRDRLLLKEIR